MKVCLIICLLGIGSPCHAQEDINKTTIDTTLSLHPKDTEKKWQWKDHILPLSLIASGTALSFGDIKSNFHKGIKKTNTRIDNYFILAPAATLYLADALGVKHKNTVWNHTKYLFLSLFTTAAITVGTQFITNVDRPDGTRRSFPSGHTSLCFAGAEVLRQELKDSNPYWAYSGYLFATSTSVLRLTNIQTLDLRCIGRSGTGYFGDAIGILFRAFKKLGSFFIRQEKISNYPKPASWSDGKEHRPYRTILNSLKKSRFLDR